MTGVQKTREPEVLWILRESVDGVEAEVLEAARRIAREFGPEVLFAVPFDGSIALGRRYDCSRILSGREVEVLPGGSMSLVADFPFEQGGHYCIPLDTGRAVAWLRKDTRTGEADPSSVPGLLDVMTPEQAQVWWDSPQSHWHGMTPREALAARGPEEVLSEARRITDGAYG